jgi:hypothetical protein
MNIWFASGSALLTFTAVVHLFVGEGDVHRPLLAAAPAGEMDIYVSALWHGITALLSTGALALGWAALRPFGSKALAYLVGSQVLGFAAVTLAAGFAHAESVWIVPQWAILGACGALAFIGAARAA